MSANIRNYISTLPTRFVRETAAFMAYYSLQSLDAVKKNLHRYKITRVVAPNLLKNPAYTGLVRPIVDVIWQTGEYIVQQKEEDGVYFISQIISHTDITFDVVIYKNGNDIWRYIVEHNAESSDPYSNFTLIDIHKEVNEHIKMSMKFEDEFPQIKHLAINMAESVLANE